MVEIKDFEISLESSDLDIDSLAPAFEDKVGNPIYKFEEVEDVL